MCSECVLTSEHAEYKDLPQQEGLCRLAKISLISHALIAGCTEFGTAGACWMLWPSTSHPAVPSRAVLVTFPGGEETASLTCCLCSGLFCAGKGNINTVQRGVEEAVLVNVFVLLIPG